MCRELAYKKYVRQLFNDFTYVMGFYHHFIIGNIKNKKRQQIKFIIINIVVTTDKISLCQHSLGHWRWHWHWYVNEKSSSIDSFISVLLQ